MFLTIIIKAQSFVFQFTYQVTRRPVRLPCTSVYNISHQRRNNPVLLTMTIAENLKYQGEALVPVLVKAVQPQQNLTQHEFLTSGHMAQGPNKGKRSRHDCMPITRVIALQTANLIHDTLVVDADMNIADRYGIQATQHQTGGRLMSQNAVVVGITRQCSLSRFATVSTQGKSP